MYVGYNISVAIAIISYSPGLTKKGLEDAMEYAGLETRRRYDLIIDVHEISTAYAASGIGLYALPSNLEACHDREKDMIWSYVLSVSFNNEYILLEYAVCFAATHVGIIYIRILFLSG
jgi:hypothetical protein